MERMDEHPYTYLYKWYNNQQITQIAANVWVLDTPQSSNISHAQPLDLGVANTKGCVSNA
jgi:hypothetical protein